MALASLLRLLALVLAGGMLCLSACAQPSPKPLPADVDLQLGPHGTPRLIKGVNLAFDLHEDPGYRQAKQQRNYPAMAVFFLTHRQAIFRLADPSQDLRLVQTSADNLGHTHLTYRQVVAGIPVWQKALKIHFNDRQYLHRVDGDYLPTPIDVSTAPILPQSAAETAALEGLTDKSGDWTVKESQLIIYAPEQQTPELAYEVIVAKGLTEREVRILAADSGRLLKRLELVHQ